MEQIRTAIIGCGMISNIYIKNCLNLFEVIDLAALCDLNEAAAREKSELFGVPVRTMEEILGDEEIRMVINLTGPAAHYSVIRQCLLAGKHVFTEKMLCTDFQQGQELVKLADEKGLYLGVAPDTFLGAGLQTARFAIDHGLIGRVTSCRAAINRNQALNSETFRYIRNRGGGFAYDVGVYYVTALLSLLGPVKWVSGFVGEAREHQGELYYAGNYGQSWKTADNNLYTGALQFESGVLGTIHFDGESIDDEQPSLVIYGTEGILFLGDPNNFNGEVKLCRNGAGSSVLPFTHGYTGSPIYGAPTPGDYGQHRGVGAAEMAWSILKDRPNRASKEMGLHTMEILVGLDESARTKAAYQMQTSFRQPRALASGHMDLELGGFMRGGAEAALAN